MCACIHIREEDIFKRREYNTVTVRKGERRNGQESSDEREGEEVVSNWRVRGCETKLTYTAWKKMPQSKSLPNFIRFPKFDSRTCCLTVLDKFPTMQFKKGNCLSIIAVYNIRDANTTQHNLSVLLLLRFYCNTYSPGRMGL